MTVITFYLLTMLTLKKLVWAPFEPYRNKKIYVEISKIQFTIIKVQQTTVKLILLTWVCLTILYPSNLNFAYLNINSVRKKFENCKEIITGNIITFIIAETKLDGSFRTSQFELEGYYWPFHLDISTSNLMVWSAINDKLEEW